MKKTLIVGTCFALIIMTIVSISGIDAGFNLLMNTGIEHSLARLALVGALVTLLITSRPRAVVVRALLGVISLGVLVFAIAQTIDYQLGLLDTVAYFLAGLMISIEAFEPQENTVQLPAQQDAVV
ncbi:hypothetical protein IPM09_05430 [Candidatus Saccharibacteria bacterium]|nr:MAG: hypothetical protein IPM09_05430 [Candidatus Saccharibacteria bacterium]